MKKHDEGYALLLVVVTLLVLAIMSAALMSMGVRNLKNQKASLEQMVDKYDAQGEMEIKVAKIEAKIAAKPDFTIEADATVNNASSAVEKWITELGLWSDIDQASLSITEEGIFSCEIPLTAKSASEKTQISCVLELTGTVETKTITEEGSTEQKTTYEVKFGGLNYTSYNISEGGAGG